MKNMTNESKPVKQKPILKTYKRWLDEAKASGKFNHGWLKVVLSLNGLKLEFDIEENEYVELLRGTKKDIMNNVGDWLTKACKQGCLPINLWLKYNYYVTYEPIHAHARRITDCWSVTRSFLSH